MNEKGFAESVDFLTDSQVQSYGCYAAEPMLEEADKRGLDVNIAAYSASEFNQRFADYQVVLLGPQIK